MTGSGDMGARLGAMLVAATVLSGCGSDTPTLFNLRAEDRTPDEFAILPTRPLEVPPDLSTLPPPLPGGVSRTDPQPQAQAVAALGGNAAGGTAADGALVAAVSRYGVAGDIRSVLAAEDLEYRRRNDGRLLERLFNVTVYYDAYEPLSLDQYRELERLRRAGVRTPAAPPDPETLE